jgi:hypothetical protein
MKIQNDEAFKRCHLQLSTPSLTQDEEDVVVTPPMYHLLVHPNASVKVTMICLVPSARKECAAQTERSPLHLRDITSISMTRLESKERANQTERPLSSFKIPSTPQSQSRSSSSQLVATGSQTNTTLSPFISSSAKALMHNTSPPQIRLFSSHPSSTPAPLEAAVESPCNQLRKRLAPEDSTDRSEPSPLSTPSQTIYGMFQL